MTNQMLKILLFILPIFLSHVVCSQNQAGLSKQSRKNFQLMDDFEKNKTLFKHDSFDLSEISVDGGKAIAYHSEKLKYKVFDLMLSGETEKIHYVFYADKNSTLKLTKQTEYQYDKPRATDNTIKERITYYSIEKHSYKAFDAERNQIKEPDPDKKNKIDKLFEKVVNKK